MTSESIVPNVSHAELQVRFERSSIAIQLTMELDSDVLKRAGSFVARLALKAGAFALSFSSQPNTNNATQQAAADSDWSWLGESSEDSESEMDDDSDSDDVSEDEMLFPLDDMLCDSDEEAELDDELNQAQEEEKIIELLDSDSDGEDSDGEDSDSELEDYLYDSQYRKVTIYNQATQAVWQSGWYRDIKSPGKAVTQFNRIPLPVSSRGEEVDDDSVALYGIAFTSNPWRKPPVLTTWVTSKEVHFEDTFEDWFQSSVDWCLHCNNATRLWAVLDTREKLIAGYVDHAGFHAEDPKLCPAFLGCSAEFL